MVVVEADGNRVALLVDELLGQHQVVVKNLESNYRKVPNVSGQPSLVTGGWRSFLILVAWSAGHAIERTGFHRIHHGNERRNHMSVIGKAAEVVSAGS